LSTPCASCDHPQVREINHRIKEERPLTDISRWLDELGTPITRQALARHAKAHMGVAPSRGRRPVSGDFLELVRDTVHEGVLAGELVPTIKDGIKAATEIERNKNRNVDRDIALTIAALLGGHLPFGTVRVIDSEVEAIEAEFRPLLTAGE